MNDAPELIAEIRNGIAHLTLNRPQALNALTHGMIHGIGRHLADWAVDPGVRAIVFRGAGEKAFCAGGDIRALYEAGKRHDGSERQFFVDEYRLNHTIHRYLANTGKPILAWIDGIVMGGGMGISQGAPFKVVGSRTRLAMPETAIGLFPDVGGSYFLSRAPGAIGLYLGLTGQVIKAADAIHAKLATHHVADAATLDAALDALDWRAGTIPALTATIEAVQSPPEGATLPALASTIEKHFAGKRDVPTLIASLETESGQHAEWARATAAGLLKKSPTLLEVTKRQIERAATMTLADCFRMELDLVTETFVHGDVIEGIRALLIDKDQNPQWRPATLAEVDPERVNAFFRSRWDAASHPLKDL